MPYTFRLSDLPKFDLWVDRGLDFETWKTQWTSYVSLSGLGKESAVTQLQALTLFFSRETLTIVDSLGLTTEQCADVQTIITAIKQYVEGHINKSVERHNFWKQVQVQQCGETFDDYVVALDELVKTCNFCSKNIRDQLIEGLIEPSGILNIV